MHTIVTAANYSFLIETFTDDGSRLMMWRIDQHITNPFDSREVRRVTNQVEQTLHGLNARTGLEYSCFAQGPVEEINQCIRSRSLEIS